MKAGWSLIVVGFLVIGTWFAKDYQQSQLEKVPRGKLVQVPEQCEPRRSPCHISLPDGGVVGLIVLGEPSPLQAFTMALEAGGMNPHLSQAWVSFEMVGMDMGVNQSVFRPINPEAGYGFSAEVLLPVCTTRKTDWVAYIHLIAGDKHWTVRYLFSLSGHER
ncbi:MAG: hypothetical protein ACWA5X_07685 [bacterium]